LSDVGVTSRYVKNTVSEDLRWEAKRALHELNSWLSTADAPSDALTIRDLDSKEIVARIYFHDIKTILELSDPEGPYSKLGIAPTLGQVMGISASAVIAANVLAIATFPFGLVAVGAGMGLMAHARRKARDEKLGRAVHSWYVIEKFVRTFFEEIKGKICKGRRGDAKLGTSVTAAISALTSWLVSHFGLHDPVAYGLATAILITIVGATKQAFCKITVQEYMVVIGFASASDAVMEMIRYKPAEPRGDFLDDEDSSVEGAVR
jgi:hypothetical protein